MRVLVFPESSIPLTSGVFPEFKSFLGYIADMSQGVIPKCISSLFRNYLINFFIGSWYDLKYMSNLRGIGLLVLMGYTTRSSSAIPLNYSLGYGLLIGLMVVS